MLSARVRLFTAFGIVLFVVLLVTSVATIQPIIGYAQRAIRPIQHFFYGKTVQEDISGENKTPSELRSEIGRLQKQVATLEQHLVTASTEKRECQDLKKTLSFVSGLQKRTGLAATVIGRGVDGDASLIMIDQGAEQGIGEGFPVITPEGAFIGTVYKVTPATSFVRLITHPHAAVAVARESDGVLAGMVQGKFGLSAELTLVPRESGLRVGDIIYTAGLDERIPAGMLVGTVETVEEEKNTQFNHGLVRVTFSSETLRLVTVLQPKN